MKDYLYGNKMKHKHKTKKERATDHLIWLTSSTVQIDNLWMDELGILDSLHVPSDILLVCE